MFCLLSKHGITMYYYSLECYFVSGKFIYYNLSLNCMSLQKVSLQKVWPGIDVLLL